MSSDRHRRMMQILAEAMDLPGAERTDLLDRACQDDEPLRHAIDNLLAHQEAAGGFLEDPLLELTPPA